MKETHFEDVESARNVSAISKKQKTFIPQVDYSNTLRFARYGSAYLYYKSAIEWIHDYYPYDGSSTEINQYVNGLLDIEKFILNKPKESIIILQSNNYYELASHINCYPNIEEFKKFVTPLLSPCPGGVS